MLWQERPFHSFLLFPQIGHTPPLDIRATMCPAELQWTNKGVLKECNVTGYWANGDYDEDIQTNCVKFKLAESIS